MVYFLCQKFNFADRPDLPFLKDKLDPTFQFLDNDNILRISVVLLAESYVQEYCSRMGGGEQSFREEIEQLRSSHTPGHAQFIPHLVHVARLNIRVHTLDGM